MLISTTPEFEFVVERMDLEVGRVRLTEGELVGDAGAG